MTAVNAQAGNHTAAENHLAALLALSPRYGKIARVDLAKWFVEDSDGGAHHRRPEESRTRRRRSVKAARPLCAESVRAISVGKPPGMGTPVEKGPFAGYKLVGRMTDDNWERVKEIAAGALELDLSARARFLQEACGADEAVRAEVASLLSHADDRFLERTPPLTGRKLSHYEVKEELSRGGMGIVYRALDLKLEREVALKVLPRELLTNARRKRRLFREARVAAALKHPNVAHIYEVDEADGETFIVMELIEGEKLSQILDGEPLSLERALDLAIEIAEGVAKIHEKGIVHRDLKPANVMVNEDGRVKIIDFGVSKLLDSLADSSDEEAGSPRASSLTETGQRMGTLPYMSPEQRRGDVLDHRSDVFSFGVVLYEMLTGARPFEAGNEAETSKTMFREPARPLPLPSRELEPVLDRCLAKDPNGRYSMMTTLLADLEARRDALRSRSRSSSAVHRRRGSIAFAVLGLTAMIFIASTRMKTGDEPRPASVELETIAVLPFENLGPSSEAYLADGISDEIRARLSGLSELAVIARQSAIQYRGSDKSAQQIGEELGADFLLGGTIQVSEGPDGGFRVRVRPQLTRADDATQPWAAVYDQTITDPFQLETEIANKVVDALGITLLASERRTIDERPTDNLEAYRYYLRGNEHYQRGLDEENLRTAARMYEEAVSLDPSFALAYAKLSQTHALIYWFFYDHSPERRALAKRAADGALRLAPDLPDAHAALGFYHHRVDYDFNKALSEFRVAQRANPNDSNVLTGIGLTHRRQGLFEESLKNLKAAAELDSRSPVLFLEIGATQYLARHYREAERYYERAISLDPDGLRPYAWKAWLYLDWHGDVDAARVTLNRAEHRAGTKDYLDFIVPSWISLDLMEGKYRRAIDRLSTVATESFETQFWITPKDQLYAQIYQLMNEPKLERAHYERARAFLASEIEKRPEEPRLRSALGIVYAGLDREEDAIREGRLAADLLPMTRDAFRGAYLRMNLAQIYVMTGELDAALDEIERMLSISSPMAGPRIRLDPLWSPLRSHPRFERVLSAHASDRATS